jgi:hypothetical protein
MQRIGLYLMQSGHCAAIANHSVRANSDIGGLLA